MNLNDVYANEVSFGRIQTCKKMETWLSWKGP